MQWLLEATKEFTRFSANADKKQRLSANAEWKTLLPQLAAYPRDHFDYALDDDALAKH